MSVVWMLAVAALVFAEKVLPIGERLAQALAVCLVLVGIWVAAAPGTVPGLTTPGTTHAMSMSMTSSSMSAHPGRGASSSTRSP
jgi:hypothetical protein